MVSEDTEQHMIELLGEILRWTKIGALNLRESLAQELDDSQKRLVYELTDGIRSTREIEEICRVPARTVASWWSRWKELGFVDSSPKYQGRVQRLCSLRMLGIAIPEVGGGTIRGSDKATKRRPKLEVAEDRKEDQSEKPSGSPS
jgi:hypothetical protein